LYYYYYYLHLLFNQFIIILLFYYYLNIINQVYITCKQLVPATLYWKIFNYLNFLIVFAFSIINKFLGIKLIIFFAKSGIKSFRKLDQFIFSFYFLFLFIFNYLFLLLHLVNIIKMCILMNIFYQSTFNYFRICRLLIYSFGCNISLIPVSFIYFHFYSSLVLFDYHFFLSFFNIFLLYIIIFIWFNLIILFPFSSSSLTFRYFILFYFFGHCNVNVYFLNYLFILLF
jgi:hypothetical protein